MEELGMQMFKQNTGWIGIDVGTSSIKLAQIEQRQDATVVSGLHRIAFDQAIEPNKVAGGNLSTLNEALRQFVDSHSKWKNQFVGREVAVCLSASLVSVRNLELPEASDEELQAMVAEEIALESPELSGVPVGYWPNPVARPADPAIVAVSAVAIGEDLSTCISDAIWNVGYEPVLIDVQYCALARAAHESYKSDVMRLVIDIGYESSTVLLCSNGAPVHSRKLRECGLKHCLDSMCDRMQLDRNEAYVLLNECGLPANPKRQTTVDKILADIIVPTFGKLILELDKTIKFYQSRFGDLMPTELIVCGGGASVANIDQWLGSQIGLAVSLWSDANTARDQDRSVDRTSASFVNALAMSSLQGKAKLCM